MWINLNLIQTHCHIHRVTGPKILRSSGNEKDCDLASYLPGHFCVDVFCNTNEVSINFQASLKSKQQ